MNDQEVNHLNRAHRNARTIVWLERQAPDAQLNLRVGYARELDVPWDEVIWLPEPMDDDSLNWVYHRCANWINHA